MVSLSVLVPTLQDLFVKRVRRIFEQIEENVLENTYEFLSEDDMSKLGWSEKLDGNASTT